MFLCVILSPLSAVLGMQPPLPREAVRELVCSCLHRDPVAADLRCSLFVAAAQSYKRDSLLRPFPPRYISGETKEFEELVRHTLHWLWKAFQSISAYISSTAIMLSTHIFNITQRNCDIIWKGHTSSHTWMGGHVGSHDVHTTGGKNVKTKF